MSTKPLKTGVQETIIYRLVMRNLSLNTYFSFLICWATFGGKTGVATTRALMVWGLQTQPKVGPLGGPFPKET